MALKKYHLIISGTCFHRVISFTSSSFGISSLFHHTQRTLSQNREYSRQERLMSLERFQNFSENFDKSFSKFPDKIFSKFSENFIKISQF